MTGLEVSHKSWQVSFVGFLHKPLVELAPYDHWSPLIQKGIRIRHTAPMIVEGNVIQRIYHMIFDQASSGWRHVIQDIAYRSRLQRVRQYPFRAPICGRRNSFGIPLLNLECAGSLAGTSIVIPHTASLSYFLMEAQRSFLGLTSDHRNSFVIRNG